VTWTDAADFARALDANQSTQRAGLVGLLVDTVSDPQRGLDLMGLLQAVDADPKGSQAWDDFRANWNTLDQLAEYRALHISDLGRDALNFLEARSRDGAPYPPDQAALTHKLLQTVAILLSRDNTELTDQLLALAARKPDEFYGMLDSISQLIQNGELPRLLDLIQTKLGPPIR